MSVLGKYFNPSSVIILLLSNYKCVSVLGKYFNPSSVILLF